jgi:hypothetical protein
MIPTWLTNSIWMFWSLWTLLEIWVAFKIYDYNSNDLLVRLTGKVNRTNQSKVSIILYWPLTILWFNWIFFG